MLGKYHGHQSLTGYSSWSLRVEHTWACIGTEYSMYLFQTASFTRNMHFKFLHDSSSSIKFFLFRADNIALSGCTKVCISIHLCMTSWLLPHFGSYEWVNSTVVWQQTLYDLYYFKLVKLCFLAQNMFCFWWIFHVKLKTMYILLLLDEVVSQCQLYLDDWWHCWFQLYS